VLAGAAEADVVHLACHGLTKLGDPLGGGLILAGDRLLIVEALLAAGLMPTLPGNALRAGELRTSRRYGLDPVIAWPRLWPLLTEPSRADIAGARGQLDAAGRAVLWAAATALWAVLLWWLAIPALVAAVAIYRFSVLPAAAVYADLVETAFDTQRTALHRALRLAPPASRDDEPAAGRALTAYLFEGHNPSGARFTT
jgi:hypothetical protein